MSGTPCSNWRWALEKVGSALDPGDVILCEQWYPNFHNDRGAETHRLPNRSGAPFSLSLCSHNVRMIVKHQNKNKYKANVVWKEYFWWSDCGCCVLSLNIATKEKGIQFFAQTAAKRQPKVLKRLVLPLNCRACEGLLHLAVYVFLPDDPIAMISSCSSASKV